MKRKFLALLLSICWGGLLFAQSTQSDQGVKSDMKQAGHSTGDAAKKAGHKTKKATKKVVHKGAHKTRKGAKKVEQKTQPPQ